MLLVQKIGMLDHFRTNFDFLQKLPGVLEIWIVAKLSVVSQISTDFFISYFLVHCCYLGQNVGPMIVRKGQTQNQNIFPMPINILIIKETFTLYYSLCEN